MDLEEGRHQGRVGRLVGVVHDLHRLGVPGTSGADLLVVRVRGVAAGVAHRGRPHPRLLPEDLLGTPEAAEPEDGALVALGERRLDRPAGDEMGVRHRELVVVAAG